MTGRICGRVLVLCFVFQLVCKSASAQVVNPFLIDATMSGRAGTTDLATLQEMLVQYEQDRIPEKLGPEDSFSSRLLGRLYRFGKTVLLENIQDFCIGLVNHEMVGHGARFREYGATDIDYTFHLPPPYYWGGSAYGSTYGAIDMTQDQYSAMAIAGVQASDMLAQSLRVRMMERDSINYREANLFFGGRLDLTRYAWRTTIPAAPGNDMANYVRLVSGRNPSITLKSLQTRSLLNLLDPMCLTWFYSYFYNYLLRGNEKMLLPSVQVGSLRYLPGFRYAITPFGYEYVLENFAWRSSNIFELDLRAGSADESISGAIECAVHNLKLNSAWNFDGRVIGWTQPALSPSSAGGAGFLVSVTPMLRLASSPTHIIAEIGYKTAGFVEGELLDAGPFVRAGISFEQ